MQKIAVLTGAGMSAESGLRTFRDADGLWEGHDVTKVATPEGWYADQELVLTRSGQKDRHGDEGFVFESDVNGRVSIPLYQSGTHLVMARTQATAPQGAETDIRSYTTSMTLSVN